MVRWTPKSEEDLDEIRHYISKNFSVDLAIETVDKLVDFVEKSLSNNPLLGVILETNPLFSKLIYEENSIYYCENPKDKHIYIVYVQARKKDLDLIRISDLEV